ncbi:MAG: ABC transporter substrate-binding protein [Thermoguttaceae bacterium]|jgi:branched-chain amino acid transport system substrate-binding protein
MKTAAPVLLSLAVLALFVSAVRAADAPESPTKPKPYYDYREHATPYAGPGREAPEPAGVREVLLGYFGPNDPQHAEGGDAWCAAQMAVEEANRDGGYRGKSFRLVPGWSDNPWKAGVVHVTRMAYTDNVWAILGGIDGPSTHLAEQVVAKACLPLVSPGNTDRTANLANVAWMFSCLPSDHVQAPVLADAMVGRIGHGPFEVLTDEEHDSRCLLAQLRRAFAERRISPRHQYVCRLATDDPAGAVSRVVDAKPAAVVVLAGAQGSARLLRQLRTNGFSGPIFGGPAMGRRRFLEEARDAAEGVLFPLLYDRKAIPGPFADAFEKRFHHEPDFTAAAAYDSVQLTVAAVRKAGLNRARIGDALHAISPWKGACGTIQWDSLGSNIRPIHLGTIHSGHRQAVR